MRFAIGQPPIKNRKSQIANRKYMIRLEIVTPEKRVLDAEVDSVTVPTATGEAGILSNHAPLISALKPGVLTYSVKGTAEKLAVSGGFVEVNSDMVSVLVDSAETADEIDVSAAKSDMDMAEKAIAAAGLVAADESANSRDAVEHAAARLRIAAGK
ncbi:MAG: F0F1 ATP synthase subunit epsilon [Pyrinomonadaceae bacterium]